MTNKEILQADLLDIVFDNRNKSYGAYRLRKEYNQRLTIAVSAAILLLGIASFIAWIYNPHTGKTTPWIGPGDTVTLIELPKEIPPPRTEPAQPPAARQPPVASIKSTSRIDIVPDQIIAHTDVPDAQSLADKLISDHNADGPLPGSTVPLAIPQGTGAAAIEKPAGKNNDFLIEEKAPEFPGGINALMLFFSRNLATPDDLAPGEKRTVLAKFKVDTDGSISQIEIVQSAGDRYDKEVIRVFKKMPRWKPAVQNGHHVAIYFTQPVTFIGVDW